MSTPRQCLRARRGRPGQDWAGPRQPIFNRVGRREVLSRPRDDLIGLRWPGGGAATQRWCNTDQPRFNSEAGPPHSLPLRRLLLMSTLSKSWRVYSRRDPERAAQRLKKRFAAVTRRIEQLKSRRRIYRAAKGPALLGFALGGLGVAVFGLSPFPPTLTLMHIAALPNCAAARVVGLAPSRTGQPGYYVRHDADNDGVACEPWP